MDEKRINDTTPAQRQEPPMPRQSGMALVDRGSMAEFDRRWHAVQTDFVEDPRRAVSEAGNLMAELMDHVAKNLRQRRTDLDRNRTGETDTEAMRLEMRRYKDLMSRMLHEDTSSATPQTPPQARQQPMPNRTADQPTTRPTDQPTTRPTDQPTRRAND